MSDASGHARHTHTEEGLEDRRLAKRVPASEVPYLQARMVAGTEVTLVDISRRGVLLETDSRLLPGKPIEITFVAADTTLVLKGCVVRSAVAVLSDVGLKYRIGVSFDEDITVCEEALGGQDPPAAGQAEAESPLPAVPPGRPTATTWSPWSMAVVTARTERRGEDLRQMLMANNW